jgi:hypothetical protein
MSPSLRPALGDLVHRYAAYADQRRLDDLAGLFVPDGELVLPAPPDRLDAHRVVTGREAIVAELGALHGLAVTAHELVGEVYDGTDGGDGLVQGATGRVACVAHHVSEDRDAVWHLHYDDRYALVDGRWRFARRELHVDLITTGRVHRHR